MRMFDDRTGDNTQSTADTSLRHTISSAAAVGEHDEALSSWRWQRQLLCGQELSASEGRVMISHSPRSHLRSRDLNRQHPSALVTTAGTIIW